MKPNLPPDWLANDAPARKRAPMPVVLAAIAPVCIITFGGQVAYNHHMTQENYRRAKAQWRTIPAACRLDAREHLAQDESRSDPFYVSPAPMLRWETHLEQHGTLKTIRLIHVLRRRDAYGQPTRADLVCVFDTATGTATTYVLPSAPAH